MTSQWPCSPGDQRPIRRIRLGVDAAQQQLSEATLASLLASVKTLNPIYCGQLRGYPACRTVNAAGGRSTTVQSNNGGDFGGGENYRSKRNSTPDLHRSQ